MKNTEIRLLRECDEKTFEKICSWMYEWWGKAEDYSYKEIECYMSHSMNEKRLPRTYAIYCDNELCGIYQFTLNDIDIRPDIYPWLANVFIDESHRGQGLSLILLDSIKHNAIECGFDEIYLFTEHTGYYERFGFEFISDFDTFRKTPRIQRLYRMKLK